MDHSDNPGDKRTGQAYILFSVSLILVTTLGTITQLPSIILGLGFTELVLFLLPTILFVRRKRLPVAEALRWRGVRPGTAILSLAVGVTCWGVAAGIYVLSLPILGESPTVEALNPRTLADLTWVLIFAALLPGICEESLFRGAIQGILGRKGHSKSILITAFLFSVYHVNPWVLVPGFFLGIVFGTLVARTGSILPAVLAHLANNSVAFTATYLYHDQPEWKAYVLMGVLAAGCLVTFPAFWLVTRGLEVRPTVLETVPAGVERPRLWILGIAGGSVLAFVLAVAVGAFLFVGLHTVADDSLAPDYKQGDYLLMFNGGKAGLDLDLEAGDVVSFRPDGMLVLRKIGRLNAEEVWVLENGKETRVSRRDIIGKVVDDLSLE